MAPAKTSPPPPLGEPRRRPLAASATPTRGPAEPADAVQRAPEAEPPRRAPGRRGGDAALPEDVRESLEMARRVRDLWRRFVGGEPRER